MTGIRINLRSTVCTALDKLWERIVLPTLTCGVCVYTRVYVCVHVCGVCVYQSFLCHIYVCIRVYMCVRVCGACFGFCMCVNV